MNFRSFNDMNRTIAQNLHKVPTDTDLIVGIPRSGLMAASILAMHLQLPITDSSGFFEGKILSLEGSINGHEVNIDDFKKILVIDDSVRTGRSIKQVRTKLHSIYPDKEFIFTAVYADKNSKKMTDIYFEVCPVPRVFEWNIMNHLKISKFCVEIDGVLCESINYDYKKYRKMYLNVIENARPMFRTKTKIGYLVTNRPVEFRNSTEKWLNNNGIKYKELIMQDIHKNKHNIKGININKYKADYYKNLIYSRMFIESSYKNACEIAQLSGKLVYTVDRSMIVRPKWISAKKRYIVDFFKKIKNKINER